eukprot:s7_g68.t1
MDCDDFDAANFEPEEQGPQNDSEGQQMTASAPPWKRRRTTRGGDGASAKTCFAGSCNGECVKGKRRCLNHNRIFDAMSYHARKDKETEAFNKVMSNAIQAERAFNRFMEDNPIEGKWTRKRFIEWNQFKKEHSLAIVQVDRRGAKPFEKTQWLQRGMNKMGWTKQQCLVEWDKHAKDASVYRDSLGLDGSLRLWIRVVEEKIEDVERTDLGGGLGFRIADLKSTSRVETSTAEKNLGDEDRDLMLDQVMKSGVPNSADDRFFNEDVPQEDEDVTPTRPKIKHEQPDEPEATPEKSTEEKKKDAKIARLMSGPAALCSFRASLSEKFTDALTARKDKMEIAIEKLKEAQEKLSKAFLQKETESKCSGNDVLTSYNALLQTCVGICEAWLDPSSPDAFESKSNENPFEKDKDGDPVPPPEVQSKQEHFLQRVKNAESHVRLSNGDMELSGLAQSEFCRHVLVTTTSPTWLVDFEANLKTHWAVQDVFQKSRLRIANDVTSYINQKARSAARNDEKKKRDEESRAVKARKAEAKAKAQKLKQGKVDGHPIFVIDEKMFRSFNDRSTMNSVDDNLSEPWIWKSCNSNLSERCKTWRNHPNVSVRLSEFGGTYKQVASFKTDGRSMAPILRKQGKSEADGLWASLFASKKVLDISKIPEGSSFMENCWYFGYDPKGSWAHFGPNGAGMIRCLASGEMRVICFGIKDVFDRMTEKGLVLNLEKMTEFALSLTGDDPIVAKGFAAQICQDDVIFVPPGMVLCEKSTSSVLLYGARKSYLLKDEAAMESYEKCIDMLEASGRDPSKMKSIVQLYKSAVQEAVPAVPRQEAAAEAAVAVATSPAANPPVKDVDPDKNENSENGKIDTTKTEAALHKEDSKA